MTTVLNAYSSAYPLITNRIRASIFAQDNPTALVASIIDTTVGHPIRTYSFPGLPRNNYGFLLEEIDGSDVVVRNLAKFDVVPGEYEGFLIRGDEQIRVDETLGFNAGLSTVTFDGTGGKPDYRNWEITPSELTGRGILARGLDYSWDKITGIFTLLTASDVLAADTYYNIHFDPVPNPIGNSYPTIRDFTINEIVTSETINPGFFGSKLLLSPSGTYMEVALPDITTVVEGRPLMVEAADTGVMYCCKFTTASPIKFAKGNLFILPNESFTIYRHGTNWRVCEANGNFLRVGQSVSDDSIQAEVFNKVLLNGGRLSTSQYARLYYDFILSLPLLQTVAYDSWNTAPTKYTLENSVFPGNIGYFLIADRRNLFERNNSITGKSGDYALESLKSHFHYNGVADDTAQLFVYGGVNVDMPGLATKSIQSENTARSFQGITRVTGGLETAPSHYLINKYILC